MTLITDNNTNYKDQKTKLNFQQPLDFPTTASFAKHPLVWFFIGVSTVCFLLGLDSALLLPQRVKTLLTTHEYWRLWTPVFVHFSFVHLLTNVYCLWAFASRIEEQSRRELILVLAIAAVLSNFAEWMVAGPQFGGLSGIVYALLAYCGALSYFKFVPSYRVPVMLNILLLLSLPLAATGVFGHFANTAHIVGLFAGLASAFVSAIIRHKKIKSQSSSME